MGRKPAVHDATRHDLPDVARGGGRDGTLRDIDALIVHSPLVGPTTTRALADALTDRGWTTVAPDLRDSLSSPQTFAAAASRAADNVEVLVGHSGAGAVLPVVAQYVDAAVVVFVDAIVPEATTTFMPSHRLVALLDQLPALDGLLPPWHEWWPPDILARLVPDEGVRAAVAAENPTVSRAFYEEPVALPELWWQRPAGFLQLSPGYDDERARADRWSWQQVVWTGSTLISSLDPASSPTRWRSSRRVNCACRAG